MTTRRLATLCGLVALLSMAVAAQEHRTSVVGYLWTANSAIVGGQVHLRDVRTGKIEAVTRTAEKGDFSFLNPPPGEYVVEYAWTGDRLAMAIGKPFTLKAGETVATFVRVSNQLPVIVPDKDTQAAKPDPRESAETAVGLAIQLLEAGDHKGFLSQFMPPDQLKSRAGTPEALETLAQAFSTAGRSERLLVAFKNAQTKTPVYDQAGTTATFQLDPQPNAPSTLVLVKIGTYWYLQN